jgi:circadian clock protein KaiC
LKKTNHSRLLREAIQPVAKLTANGFTHRARETEMSKANRKPSFTIERTPTGIQGFDEILGGGLPKGGPTLITGGPGCGKTLFGLEFIIRGAERFNEHGAIISFEETAEELARNVASCGIDLMSFIKKKKVAVDYIQIDPRDAQTAGDYDLEGLFIRLRHAIETVGARRIVIDSIEALFSGFADTHLLRAEIGRLFRWLKSAGITAIITAEKGDGSLTRHGLEEYLADCVIFLDHRVSEEHSVRRLRVIKYRGANHATDEFPFLINEDGVSIMPIHSVELAYDAPRDRVSTGVPGLDEMLGGKGLFRGNTALISGTAGTGKTTLAANFVNAACARGEKALYFAFEESASQIIRNMQSTSLNLGKWQEKGLLKFEAVRPNFSGLESHLMRMLRLVDQFKPKVVVIDPLTNLLAVGKPLEVKSMIIRVIDHLKKEKITAVFTSLTEGGHPIEATDIGVSSLIDTWLLLRDIEMQGERNRGLYILKSRGMSHSKQIREFLLGNDGVRLVDMYVSREGALVGAARVAREAQDREREKFTLDARRRLRLRQDERRRVFEAEMQARRAALEAELDQLEQLLPSEPPDERAARKAELDHRKGI